MTKSLLYKIIGILLVVGFSVILVLPTLGEKKMQIDLGTEITPEQITDIQKQFPTTDYDVKVNPKDIIVSGYGITDAVMNSAKTLPGVRRVQILPHWAEKFWARRINLGLDLQGGMRLVLKANFETMERKSKTKLADKEKAEMLQQALELLRNRIDKFGVSEPSIRMRGGDAIEVQLPGVSDPEGVKKVINITGRVEYRLVDDTYTSKVVEWMQKSATKIPLDDVLKQQDLLDTIAKEVQLPDNLEVLYYYERNAQTQKIYPAYPMVLDKDVALAGNDIQSATIGADDYGAPAVYFKTTPEGATKLATVTGEKNKDKRLAIVIDNNIRSAPNIRNQIASGSGMISGNFTMDEVKTLTRIIKEGALPVDLQIVEERRVGPSLGQDAINAGFKAIYVGLAVVASFMIIYYKGAGLIAVIGLVMNMLFMAALLSLLRFTLTLPGFAGFVLTVGMAVDANVLIYERMKEEMRAGKSVRMAILYGFDKVFWAITDSNLTNIMAAILLAMYEIGPVKGFAVTLIIGTVTTLFVALVVTRIIFEIIALNKNLKKLSI